MEFLSPAYPKKSPYEIILSSICAVVSRAKMLTYRRLRHRSHGCTISSPMSFGILWTLVLLAKNEI